MKKILSLLILALIAGSCTTRETNPLMNEFDAPFGVPPFEQIKEEHYMPAIQKGMEEQIKNIDAIVANPDPATFENTLVAMEHSGDLLTRVTNVFFNLNSANTNEAMQKIAQDVAPMLSEHSDNILLNDKLFHRIKAVYDGKATLALSPEDAMLLDKYYKDFVRGGANLDEGKKARLREINKELSLLSVKFGENVLKETNAFELVIDNESDLSGLPDAVVKAAAEEAAARGKEGTWVFTIQKPSLIPFLQFSDRRDLREKMFHAYITKGDHNDEFDNKDIVTRIANLRVEKANLLGFPTYAHYILDENMAKEPRKVYDLLNKVWDPALAKAKEDAATFQKMIRDEGGTFKLEPWDWWYYAEKLKKAKYDLEDEQLKPYFKLENVIKGVFDTATKLYGITFEERHDIPVYHPDVKTFEVKDADGSHIGILLTDYFPRDSKRGGAWMSAFRKQSKRNGTNISPIIYNVGNFTKPTAESPSLLTLEEVTTLFHEFGHALHGLLSDCTYERLSGTDVATDFVELPSQIMENWALEPEVLRSYARHYQTGEPIPDELIEKIQKTNQFNQGFIATEFLAAAFLDMDWHTLTESTELSATDFENQSMDKIGLIPEIVVRYRSPYYSHIFAGGYAAGYYSYLWAEVLDADAFQAFRETSLFDRETATKFRKYILSKGGTQDPMELYVKFRGAEPSIDPLLVRRGLK
ncbi:MAG TPA: M3 family metallopeptidase [Thermoanaerobaculia bacterium]|nr:M3 family metallopeptidase [Thermoanaerobaculia bacterium]HUM28549.1 M3 family metallopeptidase [Thermoanaerobaculia bacterium]HXK66843.1 M3 family metallopeptidase [Thermoanaerobaculia bacterium]